MAKSSKPALTAGIVMCQGIGFGPMRRFSVSRPRILVMGIDVTSDLELGALEHFAETREGVYLQLKGKISSHSLKVDGVVVLVVECDEVIVLEEEPC